MLQYLTDCLVYDFLEFEPGTKLGESVNFFFYDTVKVSLLILGISIVMGYINAFLPVHTIRRLLESHKLFGMQYLLAAIFGAVTPFCSCSSVPLFIGMVRGGIPLGVTLCFLICSPLVGEVAVALFFGMFGWKITIIYIFGGMLLSIIIGLILEHFHLERYLTPWTQSVIRDTEVTQFRDNCRDIRFRSIWNEAWGVTSSVFPYVVLGIGIGAAAHGYVPQDFFADLMHRDNLLALPAAMICAAPLYANPASIVPIVGVLVSKGVPLGTAIAFMMATVGLSLPEAIMLRKVMTPKLIAIFFVSVTLAIIILGYTFNLIL